MASVVRMKRGVLVRSPADIECDTETTSGIVISATVRARATVIVRAVFADGSTHVLEDVDVCLSILGLKQRLSQQSSAPASSQRLFLQVDQRPEASYGKALGDDEAVETALACSGSAAELHVSVWVGLLEWQVLVELRDALNYESWTKNKEGWDALEEHNDPSSCAGVTVGEDGNIIKIGLIRMSLEGGEGIATHARMHECVSVRVFNA